MRYADMDPLEREVALKVWRELGIGRHPEFGASKVELEQASGTLLFHRWVLAERLAEVGNRIVENTPGPFKRLARWWVDRPIR